MNKIGCHVSNNGKLMLAGSALEAVSYKANCFMVYLGAPQNTIRKKFEEMNIDSMHKIIDEAGILPENIIVHAPYIVNMCSPDLEKRDFGINFITREMQGVNAIGAKSLVLHPGSFIKENATDGINRLSECLKEILKATDGDNTVIALETMAGKGTEVGRSFQEIAQIIEKVGSPRIKVCLDTCHIHDAGYDIINDYEGVINEFDNVIGLDRLQVIHLNDSKNDRDTHKDRHDNFGFGKIGFETLMKFVNDERFKDIPKILETPYVASGDDKYPPYKYEIAMIRSNKFDDQLIDKIISGSDE